jgi:hypothetical protein
VPILPTIRVLAPLERVGDDPALTFIQPHHWLKAGSEPAPRGLLDYCYIESSIRRPRDESVGANKERSQAFLILCV